MSEFEVVDRPKPYHQIGEELSKLKDAVMATADSGRAIRVPLKNGRKPNTQRIRQLLKQLGFLVHARRDGDHHVYMWAEKRP